ncbi:MAG TPA: hypothetical protein V6D22_18390 [Candidatus Obscuribacterales bacterium]
MAKITATELKLLPALAALGKELKFRNQEPESDTDAAEYYGDAFMEDMSIATYSETRPNGRRSCRALASIVRVNKLDLALAKRYLGYRRGDYHDFALAATIVQALAKDPRMAPAVALLQPPKLAKVKGPFYPTCPELNLKTDSNWSFHCLIVSERSPELKESMKALAGVFRVSSRDLNKIAKRLVSQGTSEEDLEHKLHEVVIESVRTCPRFALGLSWAQPADTE